MADEKKNWLDKLSETVDKATSAASEAWESTADARAETWEKTKAAATSASDTIDQGIDEATRSYKDRTTPAAAADDENPAFAYGTGPRELRAPRGSGLNTKGWLQELSLIHI